MEFLQLHTFDVVNALSLLTIVGQCITLSIIICLIIEWIRKKPSPLVAWCTRNALLLMLIVAITATCGSLFFSDIAQWVPCKDCWLQRIFMYPQVILLAIAHYRKDKGVAVSILTLSIIGMIISIDHYSEQVEALFHPPTVNTAGVNVLFKPCDASGVSCAFTQIQFAYGYITISMMAMTAFLLNALGSLMLMRARR